VIVASLCLAPPTPAANAITPARQVVNLINHVRAQHGLPALRVDGGLRRSAVSHSSEMLQYDYFAHDSSATGQTWDARIRRYFRGAVIGETLAWATGSAATPAALVRAWLASPPHRRILLDRAYRLVGIGASRGSFQGADGAIVITADFGAA
jgi:uncharacterized protein YkwD